MKKLFLAPFLTQLLISLGLAIVVALVVIGSRAAVAKSQWLQQKTAYETWISSGSAKRCNDLWTELRNPYRHAPGCSPPEVANLSALDRAFELTFICPKKLEEQANKLEQQLRGAGCVNPLASNRLLPSEQTDPGEYSTWAYDYSISSQQGSIVSSFVVVLVCSFLLLQVGRLYCLELNSGWRRLNIAVSGTLAALFFVYLVMAESSIDEGEVAEFFVVSFGVFLSALSLILLYRRLYLWVSQGFNPRLGDTAKLFDTTATVPSRALPVAAASVHVSVPINVPAPVAVSRAETIPAAPALNSTNPREVVRAEQLLQATFWIRVWARALDVMLAMFIAITLAVFIPSPQIFFKGTAGIFVDRLFGVFVYCVVVLGYDWTLLSRFGTSPGKALFGLSVRTPEGLLLTPKAAYTRSMSMLARGLWFMLFFPWAQIASAFALSRKQSMPWDLIGGGVVYQQPVGSFRRTFGIFLAVVLLAGMALTQEVLKGQTRQEIREKVIGP